MKYPSKLRKLIVDTANSLQSLFNLNDHSLHIHFANSCKPDNEDTVASMQTNIRYLRLYLTIYPAIVADYKDNPSCITEYLTHEFIHALLGEYDVLVERYTSPNDETAVTNMVENTVQRFVRIILPRIKNELPR